jgi:hypothetical protein
MNCEGVDRHLPNLLAGDLTPVERADFHRHLEVCGSCREEVEGLVRLQAQLDETAVELPSPALRTGFYRMLAQAAVGVPAQSTWSRRPWMQAAITLFLLGSGFAAGYWLRGGRTSEGPARNQNLVLLSQGGPELRMAGILLASQGDPGDPAPAEALLDLLDRDPNESVRLAAVDALYLYGRQPRVLERLVAALPRQTSPRVQVALVDVLGGLREQRAVEALKSLIQLPGLPPEVARRAKAQLAERPL